jgi:metacaspase-1
VKDPDGDRESGFVGSYVEGSKYANIFIRLDDTICPVDFESQGQIDSDTLHKAIVSPMIREARLTVLFDCCHSGSAIELPYVYRPNSQGEVNLVDNVKQGINLASSAVNLLRGGFSAKKIQDAKVLLGGAKTFFASLQHRPVEDVNEDGLGEENFIEPWKHEGKDVWMFSGCADNQTSADTSIAGAATGSCICNCTNERY